MMRLALAVLVSSIVFASGLGAQSSATPTPSIAQHVPSRLVAKNLAKRLAADFVYPEQGARYAAALNAHADAGAYDALTGLDLAQRLGNDLQSLARDGHLRVMFQGVAGGGGPKMVIRVPADTASGPPASERRPVIMRMAPPPEMEHAGWIAPGIAFVRFNLFSGEARAVEAASKFMVTHADAQAIIFDIRTHMGGGLTEMDAIFPWLFGQPTRLATMATRKSVDEAGGSPIADVPTLRIVQGDPNFVTREHWTTPGQDRRLNQAKVFVLTSGFSASAAEHFALAFRHTRRGTLIGRTTFGANHFGGDQDLGGGYTAFIPVGRTFDPGTGKDWEGAGITPDIDVAPEDALIKALTLLGVSSEKAAQLSAQVAPKGPMVGRR